MIWRCRFRPLPSSSLYRRRTSARSCVDPALLASSADVRSSPRARTSEAMAIDGGFVDALASPAAALSPLLCSFTASNMPLVAERTAAVVAGVTPDARKASTAEASAAIQWEFSKQRKKGKEE